MRYVNFSEFRHMNTDFKDLEIFPESWTKRHSFAQYKTMPRPCSALFLVCSDIAVTFYPEQEKPLTAVMGDLVWIPAGVCYHVKVEGGNETHIDTYTLNFRLLDEDSEELLLSKRIGIFAREQNGFFEALIQSLNYEVHRSEGVGVRERRNYLKIKSKFFSLLDHLTASGDLRGTYYPIRMGAEALKNEWNQNKKIEEYAAMCGISNAYFYRCFQEWAGKSPVEYRNGIRLSNAETMLRYSDMKIKEIAETIGFEDAFYFCRIFSKHYGMSPKSYRSKFLEEKDKIL